MAIWFRFLYPRGYDCPQCGNPCEELVEGYCAECSKENNDRLHDHNHQYDEWQKLNDAERSARIKTAMNMG